MNIAAEMVGSMHTIAQQAPRWTARVLLLAIAFSFFTACATTTIQTGEGHRLDREDMFGKDEAATRDANDPEEQFFNELSAQDDAFDGVPNDSVAAVEEDDCPCEADKPQKEEENVADANDSYFDNAEKPAETTTDDPGKYAPPASGDFNEVGTASWYGRDFDGKPTASGEIYDSRKLTAAHKEIPLGSIVLVRNLENNKEALVTINDRGPFVSGRVLDMSEYGAELLGYKEQGLTTVGIRVVRQGKSAKKTDGLTKNFYNENGATGAMGSNDQDLDASSVANESSLQQYSVQVGAFSELKNARNLERYLKHYGQPVHVVRRDGTFLVKVGSFGARYDAEQMKFKLTADGYSAFVSEPE